MSVKPKTNIADLFEAAKRDGRYLKVCAPMVRYSKLEFRRLVRMYGVDLCFTPMTMTDSFCQSEKARQVEFSTSEDDTPLIAQFAANTVHEYLSAAEMVYPYVDGIDLNCGCPQRWAMQSGYGCALLKDPELMKDLTMTLKRNFPSDFSVSVKIRLQKPITKTISLCQQLERCGVSFLTIHGRTPSQRIGEPSDNELLHEVKQSLSIPMIANGDCKSLADANEMYRLIGCDGVMAARGILSNPTLFSGKFSTTPIECVQHWLDICAEADDRIAFPFFHHHLTFMMEKILRRKQRAVFNAFTRRHDVYEYLADVLDLRPQPIDIPPNITCFYDESNYRGRIKELKIEKSKRTRNEYSSENTPGKFFLEKTTNGDDNCDNDDDDDDDDENDDVKFFQTDLFDIT